MAFIPMIPGKSVKGATNKKWGVVENYPGTEGPNAG
jgi:hypothetical protein